LTLYLSTRSPIAIPQKNLSFSISTQAARYANERGAPVLNPVAVKLVCGSLADLAITDFEDAIKIDPNLALAHSGKAQSVEAKRAMQVACVTMSVVTGVQ
jgi:hypothetical protein